MSKCLVSYGICYLGGPMTGHTWDACDDWRKTISKRLRDLDIECLSPLRGKDYLKNETSLKLSYETHPLSSPIGIVLRDKSDILTADFCIFNFLNCGDRVSIGSVWEISLAQYLHKPIILIMEPDNVHNHPMITQLAYPIVHTLEDGLDLAIRLAVG